MALGINATVRSNEMDEITTAVDAGAGAGLLKIYDGTRPATGGAITTLLVTLTMTDPSFPAASGGIITANTITGAVGVAASTATWFRLEDSNGVQVVDGDVGISGSDLNLTSTSITIGGQVDVTSMVLTAGNA